MSINIAYCPGTEPIAFNDQHNLYMCIVTDLPIWNFRIYNNVDRHKATRMARFMLTKPELINLRDPNLWIPSKAELICIDSMAKQYWNSIISAYNHELSELEESQLIPLNLPKPDYTNISISDSLSYFIRIDN